MSPCHRRWPTRAALFLEMYLEFSSRKLRDPDTGGVQDDLTHLLNAVAHLQTRIAAGPAFIGLIAGALFKPQASSASLVKSAVRWRGITRRVLGRANQRGEPRAGADTDVIIDASGGTTTLGLLQGHAPPSRKFAEPPVTLVLSGRRNPHPRGTGKEMQ